MFACTIVSFTLWRLARPAQGSAKLVKGDSHYVAQNKRNEGTRAGWERPIRNARKDVGGSSGPVIATCELIVVATVAQ
jgi:hypothetical protein